MDRETDIKIGFFIFIIYILLSPISFPVSNQNVTIRQSNTVIW